MRAVQFSGYGTPDVVQVVDVEAPHAGPREIRVAVRASGLSTGEVRVRSGELGDRLPITFPYRSGFDVAGAVDEVGAEVTDVAVGDEVFGMTSVTARGGNAEYAVLTAWAPRPAAWSWPEAGAAAGGAETAARVLGRLDVRAGDTVLVHGASGATGAVVAQFAIARGATVIGTASVRNHALVRSLGVVPVAHSGGLVGRVRELAPGGVDAVVDCAGAALPDLVTLAGGPGRVVSIADLDAAAHGVHLSHSAPADAAAPGADPLAAHGLAEAVDLARTGRLRIPVAATFPLADAAAAHAASERPHEPGRIVLVSS